MGDPRRWTLLDAEASLLECTFSLAREAPGLALSHGLDVTSRMLAGGLSDGVQLVEVTSDDLSFTVIPTRRDILA